MARAGEDFERAVFEFLKRADPRARVQFDAKIKDRHGAGVRQVDAWAEATLFGSIHAKILVSCKDHARALTVNHVESTEAEKQATGAHIAILYSRSGFSEAALTKAKALGINCCRLLKNAPPEVPSEMLFEAYAGIPVYHILVTSLIGEIPSDVCWRDLGKIRLDGLPAARFDEAIERAILLMLDKSHVPAPDDENATQSDQSIGGLIASSSHWPPLRVQLTLGWHWFEGQLDAFRLNGSINDSARLFAGEIACAVALEQTGRPRGAWKPCVPPAHLGKRPRLTFTMIAFPPRDLLWTNHAGQPLSTRHWQYGPVYYDVNNPDDPHRTHGIRASMRFADVKLEGK